MAACCVQKSRGLIKFFCDICMQFGQVISPTWKGAGPDDIRLERPGTMLLEFAEAIPGAGNAQGNAAGDRRYNWQQKEVRSPFSS